MRPTTPCRSRLALLLLTPLLLAACREDGSVAPPDPQMAVGGAGVSCPADIAADIELLFASRGHATTGIQRCRTIAFQAGRGAERPAFRQASAWADWALERFRLGQLHQLEDPSTEERLADLITRIMALAGGTDDFEVPEGAFGPDGGFWVVDENGGEFPCPSGECGLAFEAGTFSEPTPAYCSPIDDDPAPLNTSLDQYPRFFECDAGAEPALPFTVGLCSLAGDATNVGHNLEGGGFEVLPLRAAEWLDCDLVGPSGATLPGRVWATVAAAGRRLLGVRPLHASVLLRGPLGGLAGSFSEFGAVDARVR